MHDVSKSEGRERRVWSYTCMHFSPTPTLATTKHTQGYALVEFGKRGEAERAIKEMDGETLYGREVHVDWAFVNRT